MMTETQKGLWTEFENSWTEGGWSCWSVDFDKHTHTHIVAKYFNIPRFLTFLTMCCMKKNNFTPAARHSWTPSWMFWKIIVLVNWMAASSGLLNDTTLAVWRHVVFVFFLFFSGVDGQQKRPLDGVVTVHESQQNQRWARGEFIIGWNISVKSVTWS